MVASVVLGLIAPLSAQNLVSNPRLSETSLETDGSQRRFIAAPAMPGSFDLPAAERAKGDAFDDPVVFSTQDAISLETNLKTSRNLETVVDLDVLNAPSPYRKVIVSAHVQPYELSDGSIEEDLAAVSAVYREVGQTEETHDCFSISLSVEQQIKLDRSQMLEIVEREVGANPDCSCEVVKTAIMASEADVNQVVAIVETAIHASPESMRIISQCAIATMPDSIASVQALLTKLDPNAGESGYSSKSAKSAKGGKGAKVTIVTPKLPNPLDRPPPPIDPPPPIFPPLVTDVDPCGPYF